MMHDERRRSDGDLPSLGLGVGLWAQQARELLEQKEPPSFDFIELYDGDLEVSGVAGRVPAVLHASGLSPLGADPIAPELVRATRSAADRLGSPWVVEDIAVWRLGGDRPRQSSFWPASFDEESLEHLCGRLALLDLCLARPFACEFPPLEIVCGSLTPIEFFRRLAARTRTWLVLDVSHWLVYAQQVGRDARELLRDFPMERVIELHISGGTWNVDTASYEEEHSSELVPACVDLLANAIELAPALRAVTVECHAASGQTLAGSLATVAALPGVARLRERRHHASANRPASVAVSEADLVADAESALGREGPRSLKRRQEWTRRLLDDPRTVERIVANELVLEPAHQSWFASAAPEQWHQAARQSARRLFEAEALVRAVLTRVYGDCALAVREWFDALGDTEAASVEAIAMFVAGSNTVPAWARACLAFHVDCQRLRRGERPWSSADAGRSAESHVIRYEVPVLDAMMALARGEEPPRQTPTDMLLVVASGEVRFRALGAPTG